MALALLVSIAAQGCALLLAWHHPLWPQSATVACALWSALVAWRPRLWLFAVPFGLAFLHAAPWTGWVVFSEFDLLLLATLGGAYARRAVLQLPALAPPLPVPMQWLLAALSAAALLGLLRGLADAGAFSGGFTWDWYAGYTDALNSLRVAKAELFALLCVPLLPRAAAGNVTADGMALQTRRTLAPGMVAGLAVVVLAVLWERLAFVGLLDFSTPYRAVALFWEMHVGGEAIDGYLALASPFAVWAVLSARRPWQWAAAAALTLLTGYAALTTFSRGVYAAELTALLVLCLLLLRQGPHLQGWRLHAAAVLLLLLVAETVLVLGTGSFMLQRLQATPGDLNSRMQHWQRGLQTLHSPTDWALGKGAGRLPVNYAAQGPAGEFSGALAWGREPLAPRLHGGLPAAAPQTFATVRGPATRKHLAGQFALAQRTPALQAGPHQVQLRLRVHSTTDLQVQWCERHLLYDGRCQTVQWRVQPRGGVWQTQTLWLQDGARAVRSSHAPRLALFTLAVLQAGGAVDVSAVRLRSADGSNLLQNANFTQGLAHWQGTAQSYFLPWHIDNLFLELLIEHGLLGLLLLCGLLGAALWSLTLGAARHLPLAPYQAAALVAALCVGLSGSLLDVPRVAFLLYLLALDGVLQGCWAADAKLRARAKNQRPEMPSAQTADSTQHESRPA